jgi:hypothetical protein
VSVSGLYTVGPTQNLVYASWTDSGPSLDELYVLGPNGDLVIQGQVLAQDSANQVTLYGASYSYLSGPIGTPTVDIAQGGSFTVNASSASSQAGGVITGGQPASVTNDGTLSVTAPYSASGVSMMAGGAFSNTGSLTVTSAGTAYGLLYKASGSFNTLLNSGTITVTGAPGAGIAVGANDGLAPVSLTNSGTITAQTAIQYSGTAANITNSGTVNGAIQLADLNNTIVNTGTINGAIALGNGTNSLTSSSLGAINGSISLGAGSDTVAVLGGTVTIFLAGGTHVIADGGGSTTVSYTNAGSGVDVDLGLQGKAQNTGVGTDTLSGVTALVGSPYNDLLEGGGYRVQANGVVDTGSSATALTGGGGADTFVYRSGDGQVTITDFSGAQGDKIDLSHIASMAHLSDVLAIARQVGSNTVIDIAPANALPDILTLSGVSMTSLTASDFLLSTPVTTVTGTAANNYTATVQGTYLQYAVGSGGATVAGGPESAHDSLSNIQRIQFVDGYLDYSSTDPAGQVYRLYEATLKRAPDPEGLAYWVNALDTGTSLQTVANGFITSQEFQQVYSFYLGGAGLAGLSNESFVTILYENVLNRAPDASGLANWVNALNSGADTRAQVVIDFTESQEFISDESGAIHQGLWVGNVYAAEAARLYDSALGRLPDLSGLTNWTNSLQGGMSLQTAAADFVASQEFQSRYGALDNTALVTLLYDNVLHRAPDAGGLAHWVSLLTTGQDTRAQVVVGFSESAEHVGNTAPHIDQGIWVL